MVSVKLRHSPGNIKKAEHSRCQKPGRIEFPTQNLPKKMYIHVMKKALSKWILIELSAGLILLILFILNIL